MSPEPRGLSERSTGHRLRRHTVWWLRPVLLQDNYGIRCRWCHLGPDPLVSSPRPLSTFELLQEKQLSEGQGLRQGGDYEGGQGEGPVCASFLPGEDLG